jgi:hypothetical protein
MKIEKFIKFIDDGREVEFQYKGKKFSITYGFIDGKEIISFCEFYKKFTEIKSVEELLEVSRYNHSVKEMISQISDNDIWIF